MSDDRPGSLPRSGADVIRLRLTLAYQGTDFAGWQLQAEGKGRTVQGCLEEALGRLCGVPVRVIGSGRTDAGVHAAGQVAHADVPAARAGLPWQRALNALLPKDVAVTQAEAAPPGFHARYGVLAKTYAYTLWLAPGYVTPWRRPFVWDVGGFGPLDLAAMDEASAILTGTHDFAAFQNAGTAVKTTVRELGAVKRAPGASPAEMVLRFTGSGFLKQMVRNLVGCLVAVGRGKVSPEDVRSLLTNGRRSEAPATAPARGLCLEAVEYAGHGRDQRRLFHEPADEQG